MTKLPSKGTLGGGGAGGGGSGNAACKFIPAITLVIFNLLIS